MSLWNRVAVIAFCWISSAALFAAQITGSVTNGTIGKPAAGVEVVLLSLDGGMNEVSRTTSDGQGRFTIEIPDSSAPHLLRVNYQDVNYFASVQPGATFAEVTIYNSAKQVAGIFEDARVFRMQADRGQLDVAVSYTLRNESQPPRTKMDTETFTVDLPPGAKLVEATATGPAGMPLSTSPLPTGKKNGYALVFPIRPGETRFQVIYQMPYDGSYEFDFAPDSRLSELGVLLPKSMQFTGLSRNFSQDADEAGLAVFYVKNVEAHEQVRFSVAGEGVAPREAQGGEPVAPAAPANPPPSEPSNTKNHTFWFILAAMLFAIAGGAFWWWRRTAEPSTATVVSGSASKRQPNEGSMLDALKDELFQLEQDRIDGKVSAEEYKQSKAGLDALIRRQLKKTDQ